MTLYKWLGHDGKPCNGGQGAWHLPNGKPGEWMPKVDVDPCVSGYHLCEEAHLIEWIGPTLWVAEGRGKKVDHGDKVVFEQARLIKQLTWDNRIARLFACDCAERVLEIYEKQAPGNLAPRNAIKVARMFANGEATQDELDAAWATAWAARDAEDAAWAARAARDAARAAAWAARAARDAARAAAGVAARVAARAAARVAARAAARVAEQKWQSTRLLQYANGEIEGV